MVKKQAKDLKKGDKLNIFGKIGVVEEIEFSDIGKHGKRKVRLVVKNPDNQKVVIVRPEDYPFNVSND